MVVKPGIVVIDKVFIRCPFWCYHQKDLGCIPVLADDITSESEIGVTDEKLELITLFLFAGENTCKGKVAPL